MARPRTEPTPTSPRSWPRACRCSRRSTHESPRWSESDLRRRLGIPSSTLHRILRALEQTGYVLRDDGGHYRLGIASVRLGQRAAASLDIAAVLDRELRELGARTEELVLLAVPEMAAGLARYVGAIDSPKRLRVTAELGSAVPLTAGATAKTLLAFAPDAQVESVLRRRRERLAPGTVTSAKVLRDQLETIARRGLGPELGGDLRRRLGGRGAGARRRRTRGRIDRRGRADQPPQPVTRAGHPPGGDRRRGASLGSARPRHESRAGRTTRIGDRIQLMPESADHPDWPDLAALLKSRAGRGDGAQPAPPQPPARARRTDARVRPRLGLRRRLAPDRSRRRPLSGPARRPRRVLARPQSSVREGAAAPGARRRHRQPSPARSLDAARGCSPRS